MGERTRPSSSVNQPTPDETAQARDAVDACIQDLTDAAQSVLLRLGRLTNPIERARAAQEIRRFAQAEVVPITDTLFREAVIEAYARGRADHGWYGYGALAEELGLSRSRVQQVVLGTWKPGTKDTSAARALRESADQTRLVRRLAAAGESTEEIAAATGLTVAAVNDALG